MSWTCFMARLDQRHQPGAMWFAEPDDPFISQYLSPEYQRDHAGRRAPLMVTLPNREVMCLDICFSGKTNGWTVTGTAPNVTVSPSIHAAGRYHGWLRDGVLSDDVEGRTFESRGAVAPAGSGAE